MLPYSPTAAYQVGGSRIYFFFSAEEVVNFTNSYEFGQLRVSYSKISFSFKLNYSAA